MQITPGYVYFISDEFFNKVHDPNLKWNCHDKTNHAGEKRPFFIAFQDKETSLYWAVPLSSRTDKYKRMINQRKEHGKESDIIKIAKIHGRESAFLFLDMFPVSEEYIEKQYCRNGQPFHIGSKQGTNRMIKSAKKTKEMLVRGIKFCPTQIDVLKIEEMMLLNKEELHKERMDQVIRNMNEKQKRSKEKQKQALDFLIEQAQHRPVPVRSSTSVSSKKKSSPSIAPDR